MIGAGYVGLVSGVCFAEMGNDVICVDIDSKKIAALKNGIVPIYEPGLKQLIDKNVEAGRLIFSDNVSDAIGMSRVVFIGVGTPSRSDGGADLSAVDAVAETVAKSVKRDIVLVAKSTVPVGTNKRIKRIVKNAKFKVSVVSNPEFLKEGEAINDFLRPDRIVIGCDKDDHIARDIMTYLYHPVALDKNRMIVMDPASAELTKYVSNTMLAMRISFMNEIAGLCEKVGANVHNVRLGVGSDTRIGSKFLYAGPGYGGSCFYKDINALRHTANEHGIELQLATATDSVNKRQKGILFRKLKNYFNGDLREKRIAVWGIAFKPKTDDIRDAPSLQLIDALLSEGAEITVNDPEALDNLKSIFGDKVEMFDNVYDATYGADALVLVTEWRQYQNPDFSRLLETMHRPLIIDGRNIWTTYNLEKMGFEYDGIGTNSH